MADIKGPRQVIVRFDPEDLDWIDGHIEASAAFGSRQEAFVGVMRSWCRQREAAARGEKTGAAAVVFGSRAAEQSGRVARVCTHKDCKPPFRMFGDANWSCPLHGPEWTVDQPNHAPAADVLARATNGAAPDEG